LLQQPSLFGHLQDPLDAGQIDAGIGQGRDLS